MTFFFLDISRFAIFLLHAIKITDILLTYAKWTPFQDDKFERKKIQKYDIESLWYLERNINYTKSCTKLRFYTRYNISLTMDYEKKSNTPTVLRPVEFSGRN